MTNEININIKQPITRAKKNYAVILAVYCSLLLLSNVCAAKIFALGPQDSNLGFLPLIFDGGALLFPLTYILDDVIAELFGFKVARKAIVLCFSIGILASLVFWIVSLLPTTPDYQAQADSFSAVLGFVPRIVFASLCAYLFGQLMNSYILVKIREKTGESKALWLRLIGSTVVGEAVDTVIFCTIAFWGTIASLSDFINYTAVGYLWKCGVEIVLLPLTYAVIKWLKQPVEINVEE